MKKIVFTFLFILTFLLSSFTNGHKFYVSVTEVEFNVKSSSIQVITRVFVDDIEDLLKERYDQSIFLDKGKETKGVDAYLSSYLNEKLVFVVNGKRESFVFIGKEYEDDLIIFYLEVEDVSSLETIEVTNKVLMDLFEEQQNIVHVKKEKKRKSLILEKERETGMLKFSK
ncbi:DUF6702 family protein [Aquimarina pacifica]|uniref:DUF6702 family protein n=1 Tax=Aquimarina pacifica TaxID=1296415 RepID=UPI00046F7F8C|nr:DUF6702 family protein [Aquimarina pacifica]